jgi:hypothetical protein
MSHDVTTSPVGFALAVGGGVVAQVSPNTSVGAAGLIASLSGLLLAGFQYYKVWMDARLRDQQIASQAGQIASLQAELEKAAKRRHDMRNDFNNQALRLHNEMIEMGHRNSWLEGQLGIVDKTHSQAINAISDDVATIAGNMRPPVEVSPLRLDPIAESGDDFAAARPPA